MEMQEEIEQFTRAALNGFADLLEGADGVYKYVSNSHLAEMGLVGYMLFGKKGIALAAMVDWVNTKMAEDLANNWDYLNPSQITGGTTNNASTGGYQLGDFNNAQGPANFQEWAEQISAPFLLIRRSRSLLWLMSI